MIIESPHHDDLKENPLVEEVNHPANQESQLIENAELLERSSIAVVKNSNFKNAV